MFTMFVSISLLLKPNIFHAGARFGALSVGLHGEKYHAISWVMRTKQTACVTMAHEAKPLTAITTPTIEERSMAVREQMLVCRTMRCPKR